MISESADDISVSSPVRCLSLSLRRSLTGSYVDDGTFNACSRDTCNMGNFRGLVALTSTNNGIVNES